MTIKSKLDEINLKITAITATIEDLTTSNQKIEDIDARTRRIEQELTTPPDNLYEDEPTDIGAAL